MSSSYSTLFQNITPVLRDYKCNNLTLMPIVWVSNEEIKPQIHLQPHTPLSFAFFIHKDALTKNDFWLYFFSKTKINTKRSWQRSKQSSLSWKHKDNNPKQQLLKKIGRKQSCHQNLEAQGHHHRQLQHPGGDKGVWIKPLTALSAPSTSSCPEPSRK